MLLAADPPSSSFRIWTFLGVIAFLLAPTTFAQDTVAIEDLVDPVIPGSMVVMPLYVRDVSGTLLGVDVGPSFLIQDFGITVEVDPPGAITAIDVERAGITAALSPLFETEFSAGNRHTWIIAFDETTATVPFSLDAPAPGDLVAELWITLADSFLPPNTVLVDVVSPSALGNQPPGLPQTAFSESAENGFLSLSGGTITLMTSVFADGFESGDTSAWSSTLP